ncbi:hypothetical protein [Photobacterium phosphoreum]|uniref:hypothetical protein n=1 Tax=Photobacterium phosphoreum TaxID=659 RepID=UPI0007F8C982|nr:hypothetical protein [Photobacterium phosphoreum]MCD9481552.1 hypothetical protein [Photobacterium phosphoreum]OBU39695.1 hypothetical protein AYY25_02505 [Photobacterium phosphoreum]PSU37367.1 hypothetical protein CTM85_13695 [Photobacterium phosphoreum]PSU61472.1 hypothetical protein CTM75_12465 [Photobacterium phosphoreum]PSU78242.1 hypothetical protein CTM76_08795 [Photobacterium phosphoreum]
MLVKKMAAPQDMQNGATFRTKKYGLVRVIEYYNTHTVIVFFENTGNIRSISAAKLRCGLLADRSVPPESIMVGEKIKSQKHGLLTIVQVESENIVLLINDSGEEVRLLLPTVQKMKLKANEDKIIKEEPKELISLSSLTKRNKKTKDINTLMKKMLTDYGK